MLQEWWSVLSSLSKMTQRQEIQCHRESDRHRAWGQHVALASEGLRDTNTLSYQSKTNNHRPVWVAGRANREGWPCPSGCLRWAKGIVR